MSNRELRAAGMLVAAATLAAGAAITLSPGAPIPRATAEPSTPSSPTTSASATPTTAQFPTDDQGYVDSAARCDDGQTLMMYGRTTRSLVAVCVGPDGQLEYRGVRVSDGATLTMAASRSADGSIVAANDGVTYSITPQTLLVSEGDTVLYRDEWRQYHKAGLAAGSSTPSTTETESAEKTGSTEQTESTSEPGSTSETESTSEPGSTSESGASATTPSSAVGTTPVSTTTVTLTPSGG